MAIKGAEEKETIKRKIMETFPNAFEHGKEIRVPINEVEIKITLTCAKDNVGGGCSQSDTPQSTSMTPPTGAAAPSEADIAKAQELLANLMN